MNNPLTHWNTCLAQVNEYMGASDFDAACMLHQAIRDLRSATESLPLEQKLVIASTYVALLEEYNEWDSGDGQRF